MSYCPNPRTVDYAKLNSEIETLSAEKTLWKDSFISEIDADYSIFLNCGVHRTFNNDQVQSQSLNIMSDSFIFDKLSGQPTLLIEFNPNTLISLFNKP